MLENRCGREFYKIKKNKYILEKLISHKLFKIKMHLLKYTMMLSFISLAIFSLSSKSALSTVLLEEGFSLLKTSSKFLSNKPKRYFTSKVSPRSIHMKYCTKIDNDIESIHSGLSFTGILVNVGKIHASKISFWKECGFNISRNTDLFDFKNMKLFRNKVAENIINNMTTAGLSPVLMASSLRHKEISDTLKHILTSSQGSIKQIIILGSGFDTRAIDYKDYLIPFIEVDNATVFNLKENILRKNNIDKNANYVPLDYTDNELIPNLVKSGIVLEKGTHIIWEGNSMYLPRLKMDNLWNNIANNFKGPLSLSMDYFTEDFINKKTNFVSHKKAREPFEKLGVFFVSGFNDINIFANAHGFKIIRNFSSSDLIQQYGIHDQPVPELMAHCVAYMKRGY